MARESIIKTFIFPLELLRDVGVGIQQFWANIEIIKRKQRYNERFHQDWLNITCFEEELDRENHWQGWILKNVAESGRHSFDPPAAPGSYSCHIYFPPTYRPHDAIFMACKTIPLNIDDAHFHGVRMSVSSYNMTNYYRSIFLRLVREYLTTVSSHLYSNPAGLVYFFEPRTYWFDVN